MAVDSAPASSGGPDPGTGPGATLVSEAASNREAGSPTQAGISLPAAPPCATSPHDFSSRH